MEMTGLSAGCAGCYATLINCTIESCLTECLADPESQTCVCCREEKCMPAFATCSGVETLSECFGM